MNPIRGIHLNAKKRLQNQSIKRKVHSELVDILYNQIVYMLWAEALASTLILAILWWHTDTKLLLTWYLGMIVLTGIPRYFIAKQYARVTAERRHNKHWETALMGMLFVTGIGWSIIGTLLLPTYSKLDEAFVLFLLVGVAAAANPFYSPVKKMYATFIVPTLFFSAIFILIKGTNYAVFTGIALTAFGMLMLITSIISSELISSTLALRFKNLELAKDLLKSNIRLEKLATHDTLTDLPNRPYFYEKLLGTLKDSKRNNKSFAILFMDLDRFKNVNDTLGHDYGDELLVLAAKRMNEVIRPNDIVCRLGGDEFMLLIPDTSDMTIVANMAKQICNTLGKSFTIKNKKVNVTTSIGISVYPDDGTDEKTLIQKADMAMYETKNHTKGNFQFHNRKLAEKVRH
jgi:diguanylate cyclase (GGDEF)-like protein